MRRFAFAWSFILFAAIQGFGQQTTFYFPHLANGAISASSVWKTTIFLTNRECPWRCLMCDLWKNTTDEKVPRGAILEQIRWALEQLPEARQVKLYNSGSFFDPMAIPPEDLKEVAGLVGEFERVIVECHPALVGPKCVEFSKMIRGKLEVAMGLETAEPAALEKLNKRMSLADFSAAAEFLEIGRAHV